MKIHYSLFDTLLEPVFILNAQTHVLYCNEPAALIVGLSIRKLTRGLKFKDLFQFSEPLEALDKITTVSDSTPYKELNFRSCEGIEGKFQITLQPIFDAIGDKNWIVYVRDVTLEERLQKKYRAELEQKESVIKDLEAAKIQLENYSKNLEKMVAERTEELSRLNQTLAALLDSLGQGFFIFNSDGIILDVSSKACTSVLETVPNGKNVWDVLKIPREKVPGFQKWLVTVFSEMLPFEDLAPLGPTQFEHSQNRHISLEYYPLRSKENTIEGVVVVASDITALIEAQQQAESEKEHAKLILHLIKNKKEVLRFIQESQTLLQDIHENLDLKDAAAKDSLYRNFHTLKGGAALFSITSVANSCHEAESALAEIHAESSVELRDQLRLKSHEVDRSFADFLDKTKMVLGETLFTQERRIEITASEVSAWAHKIAALPQGTELAQRWMSDMLLEPLKNLLAPYNEILKNTAAQVGKEVAPLCIIDGNTLKIDGELYGPLFSSFVHAFRNAVDHGIETPEVRIQKGKNPQGCIEVHAELKENQPHTHLYIVIKDDGQGIDPQKIREKLIAQNSNDPTESDAEIIQHIFDRQFSTKEEVTLLSGRGVGLDAIKSHAEALGGQVWVTSSLGKGTELHIDVPYISSQENALKKSRAA